MLVPVIGIVHVGMQSMADRYSYLPLVGIFVLLAWSGAEAAGRWPWLKRPLAGLTAAALAACCLLTAAQVRLWASTETLFTHTAAVTADNSVALTNLGLVAIQKEDYAEAERQLREALRIDPASIDARGNLASMYVKQKKYDAAIRQYMEIDALCPKNSKAFGQMAHAFDLQGSRAEAEVCLRRAIELEPASVSMHKGLGLIQQMQGKIARHWRPTPRSSGSARAIGSSEQHRLDPCHAPARTISQRSQGGGTLAAVGRQGKL